ncbi:MAG: FIST C-terminal domain-containing protein [Symbiobacteriaceae bacterium]|nr:FIST C-terminal domain-containing protein [Symbiobacteriaceae bacterium]
MIKSLTAYTREVDDPKMAVAEVLDMLQLEGNLGKHSLGVISCFSDFDDSGVLKAICEALPFDCIGTTTCFCSANGAMDQVMLTITVLTSDECEFHTLLLPIDDNFQETINTSLEDFLSKVSQPPAIFLSYFPLITEISGDMILSAIDSASGGIPLFGTTATDHTLGYVAAKTIHNGIGYREAAVLGAITGAVQVSFDIASLDDSKTRRQKAVITASEGNILIGVNGKPALEYLEEIGLKKDDLALGLGVIPLVIDYQDGTLPVARAAFSLTPEGHVISGGVMPLGATIGLGYISSEDVLSTTESTLQKFNDGNSTMLCYSCMARYFVLGMDNTAEAEKVYQIMGDTPYLFSSSGGEICPLPDASNSLHNIYHNFTIVFCRLG